MAVSQLLFLHTRSKERNAATLIANGPKGMKKAFQTASNYSLVVIIQKNSTVNYFTRKTRFKLLSPL